MDRENLAPGRDRTRRVRQRKSPLEATSNKARLSGDVQCDSTDPDSVRDMFEKTGEFDSLISVVGGESIFKRFAELNDGDYRYGFESVGWLTTSSRE